MKFLVRMLLLPWLLGVTAVCASDLNGFGEIRLGMSTALSGPAADLGQDMRQGVLAGFDRANRAGGINGRHIRLLVLDDGYEPARTAPNMRQLLEKENVLAVIGNVGTPTAIVATPIADEEKTLLFAPYTGAGVLRKNPPDRYVINYRASYAEEIGAMIDTLIDGAGLKLEDIAFFTQRDGYGDAGFEGGIKAMKRHGLKDEKQVLHVGYPRNTLLVEDALAALLFADHQPKAIVMVGAYGPCAKFIELAQNAGLKAVFLNVSFVGSNPLATQLENSQAHVIVTQVVPYPLATNIPIVSEYQADLQLLDPALRPGFGSLEGYIAARLLVKALEKMPGKPTREGIINSLESMGQFDVGLRVPLKFGPSDHQASHRVWPTILHQGAFVPFSWDEISGLLKEQGMP